MKKRPALFATVAFFLMGGFGVTMVYLIGSGQRRVDRAEYLSYEQAVLVPILETRRVAKEMRSRLAELPGAVMSPVVEPGVLDEWPRALAAARSDVLALEPPVFIRDVEASWVSAIDWYAQVAVRLAQEPRQGSERALTRADNLLTEAARLMQFHRRRLGLGATSQLPDPAATRAS